MYVNKSMVGTTHTLCFMYMSLLNNQKSPPIVMFFYSVVGMMCVCVCACVCVCVCVCVYDVCAGS